jgi:hypothetical protein
MPASGVFCLVSSHLEEDLPKFDSMMHLHAFFRMHALLVTINGRIIMYRNYLSETRFKVIF